MGRLVDTWGAVPAANHYLYTLPTDAPSYNQPWLAQLALYVLHAAGGLHAALLLRNLLATAAVVALSYTAMRRSGSVVLGSLSTLAALPFLFAFIELRPHLFAWPLFLGLVWIGYGVYRNDRSAIWLVAFPAAAALWSNLHGSFPLATVLPLLFGAAAFLRGRQDREASEPWRWYAWGSAALGAALAPLANPRGAELYGYLYRLTTDGYLRTTVTEWLPTTLSNPAGVGLWFYVCLALGAGLLVRDLLVRDRRELDPADALLFGAFALLAIVQSRALLWFGLVLPIVVAPSLHGLAATDSEFGDAHPVMQRIHTAAALVLVLASIGLQPTWQWRVDWTASSEYFDVRSEAPLKGVVPDETPYEAAEILGRYADPPRIFHDHRFAGFLLFHATGIRPQPKAFVDHRIELPPRNIWREYETVRRAPNEWRAVFDEYDIGAAVLSKRRDSDLVGRLRGAEEWSSAYESPTLAFFLRRTDDG